MMIRTNKGWPPGGFQFSDPRISVKFEEPGDSLEDLVRRVIALRMANPRIYDPVTDGAMMNQDNVRKEVADANCRRLNNNPEWCYDETAKPFQKYAGLVNGKCVCGSDVEPRYCASCSNNKLIGYRCPKCQAIFDV